MNHDDWPEDTVEKRRTVIRESIRPATVEELRELWAAQFPVVNDPWAERFAAFLTQHVNDRFYLAKSPEGAHIAYCGDARNGIWFVPGLGVGFLQARGLALLADIVDGM
jgi:hypothetical protein